MFKKTIVAAMCFASFQAAAFKIDMHVHIGQQILDDFNDDGQIEIIVDGKVRRLAPAPLIRNALTQFPKAFLAGTVGPDFYPDMLVGQGAIHPGVEEMGSYLFLKDVMDSAMSTDNRPNEASLQSVAFVLGMYVHAASDTFAHTYVNSYAGDTFNLLDGEVDNELRHFLLEGYLSERILTPEQKDRVAREYPEGDKFFPIRFIRNKFVMNDNFLDKYEAARLHHLSFMVEHVREAEKLRNHVEEEEMEFLFEVSIGKWKVGLQSPEQAIISEIREMINQVRYNVEYDYKGGIDAWINANHNATRNYLSGGSVTQPYKDWVACYGTAFIGVTQFTDETCEAYERYKTLKRLIGKIEDKLEPVKHLIPDSLLRAYEETKRFLVRQGYSLAEDLVGERPVRVYQVATGAVTEDKLREVFSTDESDKNLLIIEDIVKRINRETALAYGDITRFNPTNNALQLSKLSLFYGNDINRILGKDIFTSGDHILDGLTTLDGNHQWLQQSPALPRLAEDSLSLPERAPGLKVFTSAGPDFFGKIFTGPLATQLETPDRDLGKLLPMFYRYQTCQSMPFPDGEEDKTCFAIHD